MKVRIKLNCVVDMPNIPLLDGPGILDFVQRAVEPYKATEILPGTSLAFSRVHPRKGDVINKIAHRELPARKTRRKKT